MSLRKQLLAFALLMLILPWAGFRYVQEMEGALRDGLEQSLLARASTVAQVLDAGTIRPTTAASVTTGRNSSIARPVYASLLGAPARIDGSRADWNIEASEATALGSGYRFWAGIFGRFVYVFVSAEDADVVYQRAPGEVPYGDRLVLLARPGAAAPYWLVFVTAAPGQLRAQQTSPPQFAPNGVFDDRVLSAWRETAAGFDLEVRLPLAMAGSHFGIAMIDVDRSGQEFAVEMFATWDAADSLPGRFIHQRPTLSASVEPLARAEDRVRVLDVDGWVLTDTGTLRLDNRVLNAGARSLTEDIVRFILRSDDPEYDSIEARPGRVADERLLAAVEGEAATAWYRTAIDQGAIVAAAAPLYDDGEVVGAVLLEQVSDATLTATNQALLRLMGVSVVATAAAMLGMLGFATYLSLRVRRLSRAAEQALGPKGEINVSLPGGKAQDEIGDLSRSFGDLLSRLRDHTDYLRTLTSKLSHELRTPLAVVSTSLENLEQESQSKDAALYLERLKQGTKRLDAILVAMSEATRMEQAIADTEQETFMIGAVLESCCQAYRDVYPDRQFEYHKSCQDGQVLGSRELIAQLMDKLIDNAVSFSPAGSVIRVELSSRDSIFRIAVVNRGSRLPERMRRHLFDSLVSVRQDRGDAPHLGLGLYIAALIVEFHRGRIEANNLPDGSGVDFSVSIPRVA